MKFLELTALAAAASAATLPVAPAVRYLGRVNPATKELTWPGTGVSFTFTGTSATIGLASVTGTNSVDLIIDGGKPIVISNVNGTSISTPSGLPLGNHTVVLRKRSEALYGSLFISNVTANGTLSFDTPANPRIEIYGDSISVGYGLDGVNPCTNNAAVEDNPLTYGALASEALGADYSIIAWSGIGLTRNYASGSPDSTPLMTELFARYGANDADNSYPFPPASTPDAVVIALGTNDFSYQNVRAPLNVTVFTSALVNFIQGLQTHYPKADFFLLTSPMLSDYWPTAADAQKTTQASAFKNAITQLNSTKVHFVDWPVQGSDVGCDYHPNAATHAAGSKLLVEAIKGALKW